MSVFHDNILLAGVLVQLLGSLRLLRNDVVLGIHFLLWLRYLLDLLWRWWVVWHVVEVDFVDVSLVVLTILVAFLIG